MNYYKRHLGDYAAATRHLSILEHGVYTLLLDLYYITEKPLPVEERAMWRLVGARSKDEREAVGQILNEFFELREDGWHQTRCDEELTVKEEKAARNREIGKLGGRPRKTQTDDSGNPEGFQEETQTVSKNNPSHKPITNNQEPIQKNPPNPPAGGESPSDEKPKRERKARVSLKTFVANCTQAGEKPISEYRPLQEYVETTGLPMEFVQITWDVFKREFLPPGQHAHRLQADWRRHFLNYVEKGYYRLWYARQTDGNPVYELTTQGIQAQASLREAA